MIVLDQTLEILSISDRKQSNGLRNTERETHRHTVTTTYPRFTRYTVHGIKFQIQRFEKRNCLARKLRNVDMSVFIANTKDINFQNSFVERLFHENTKIYFNSINIDAFAFVRFIG